MYIERKRAFTLIELLVTIAIISILAAILFPVFARARENARRANCMSNLKQIGLGIMQYTQDYDEQMPLISVNGPPDAASTGAWDESNGPLGWVDALQPYIKSLQVFQCPSDKTGPNTNANGGGYTDYFFNSNLNPNTKPISLAAITTPTNTLLIGEWQGANNKARSNWGGFNVPAYVEYAPVQSLYISPTSSYFSATMATIGDTTMTSCQRHLDGSNYLFTDGHVKWLKGDTGNTTSKISGSGNPANGLSFQPS